jgi:hypothetical protein
MSTRTTRSPRLTVEEVHRILDGPLELVIDDAVSYWLEDDAGDRLSEEATTTKGPFARALELHELGRDPDRMVLVARLDTGERYEVGGGLPLIDMAEAAAGIPARPRTPRQPGRPR